MTIPKHDLEKMNDLLSKGTNISDIAKKYPNYGYWEIYWEVNDFSLLGKKRSVSNRLKKLRSRLVAEDRNRLVDEIINQLEDIYSQSKTNGKKLIDIDRILRK